MQFFRFRQGLLENFDNVHYSLENQPELARFLIVSHGYLYLWMYDGE